MGKEISGAAHGGAAASTSSSGASGAPPTPFSGTAVGRSSQPFATSLQSYKAKYASKEDDLSVAQSRSFGTALHNQQHLHQQQRVDDVTIGLLDNL